MEVSDSNVESKERKVECFAVKMELFIRKVEQKRGKREPGPDIRIVKIESRTPPWSQLSANHLFSRINMVRPVEFILSVLISPLKKINVSVIMENNGCRAASAVIRDFYKLSG